MNDKSARILLVEDDEAGSAVFSRILRDAGYDVAVTSDGREAIQLLKKENFDVVLTDMLMPNVDGVELLIFIRSMPQKPVVVPMSGGGSHLSASQMLSLAVKMGALAPLVKPFTRDQLLGAIASVLQR